VVSARTEWIALDMYERAREAGVPITLEMVQARLAELRAHRPTCRCALCAAVVGRPWATVPVNAVMVHRIAARWQRATMARRCERCGAEFIPKHSGGRFCSGSCRRAAYYRRYRA
jgi:hypothetical protein